MIQAEEIKQPRLQCLPFEVEPKASLYPNTATQWNGAATEGKGDRRPINDSRLLMVTITRHQRCSARKTAKRMSGRPEMA